jgi:hypothetical protein
MKFWLLKFLLDLEEKNSSVEISTFFEEFIPYVAKHQFKAALRAYDPRSKQSDYDMKLARIMNPTQTQVIKDYIHVNVHIIPKKPQFNCYFSKLTDDDEYKIAIDEISPGGPARSAFVSLTDKEN